MICRVSVKEFDHADIEIYREPALTESAKDLYFIRYKIYPKRCPTRFESQSSFTLILFSNKLRS